MAERPDLEAIDRRLHILDGHTAKDRRQLLAYCRELEAENKRLRADIDWQGRIGDLEAPKA